jgi:hypothetical protein
MSIFSRKLTIIAIVSRYNNSNLNGFIVSKLGESSIFCHCPLVIFLYVAFQLAFMGLFAMATFGHLHRSHLTKTATQ